jgi:hypothetical protein
MSAPLRKENQESLPAGNVDLTAHGDVLEEKPQQRPRLVQSGSPEPMESEANRGALAESTNPRTETIETLNNADVTESAHLFPGNEVRGLQQQWDQIQTRFVDQPRDAVHDADALVSSSIERLSQIFADERSRLEQQWTRGENISTEELRVALQRYRSFFRRMLSV